MSTRRGHWQSVRSTLPEVAETVWATKKQMETTETPTFENVMLAQAWDPECQTASQIVGFPGSLFTYHCNRVLVRQVPVDKALQKYFPISLWTHIPYFSHYVTLTGHPRKGLMFDARRHHLIWLHIANNVPTTMKNGRLRLGDGFRVIYTCKLQLFSVSEPLVPVAIDILGPLQKPALSSQHAFIMTECYSKPTFAVPTRKCTSAHLATIFVDNWTLLYGIRNYKLSDNGLRFVRKFFITLVVKKLTINAYNAHIDGQAKRYAGKQ